MENFKEKIFVSMDKKNINCLWKDDLKKEELKVDEKKNK
jgi:hypothetical protein